MNNTYVFHSTKILMITLTKVLFNYVKQYKLMVKIISMRDLNLKSVITILVEIDLQLKTMMEKYIRNTEGY